MYYHHVKVRRKKNTSCDCCRLWWRWRDSVEVATIHRRVLVQVQIWIRFVEWELLSLVRTCNLCYGSWRVSHNILILVDCRACWRSELWIVGSVVTGFFFQTAPTETTIDRFPEESSTTFLATNKNCRFDLLNIWVRARLTEIPIEIVCHCVSKNTTIKVVSSVSFVPQNNRVKQLERNMTVKQCKTLLEISSDIA
jgi:hypothetical protein